MATTNYFRFGDNFAGAKSHIRIIEIGAINGVYKELADLIAVAEAWSVAISGVTAEQKQRGIYLFDGPYLTS